MRIDQLHLQNFKGFADRKFSFHPQFNLIIGDNASGKTTILDALAVAMGTWFLGMPGLDARNIRAEDVRTVTITESRRYELLDQYPVEVKTRGIVNDTPVAWTRTLKGPENRTTRSGATGLTRLAEAQADLIRAGKPATLPVLSYYGAGRLWLEPRDRSRPETDHAYGISAEAAEAAGDHDAAYFARRMVGYRYSVDDRCSARDLLRWLRYQRRVEVDEETESVPYRVVIAALKHVLNATSVTISLRYGTLIADIPGSGRIPFGCRSGSVTQHNGRKEALRVLSFEVWTVCPSSEPLPEGVRVPTGRTQPSARSRPRSAVGGPPEPVPGSSASRHGRTASRLRT